MFNSIVLDVGIGLIFVYLLLALICTSTVEAISARFKLRAKNLEKGILQLLGSSPDLARKFFNDPLIKAIAPPTKKAKNGRAADASIGAPSYIPADLFARVFLKLASPSDSADAGLKSAATSSSSPRAILDSLRGSAPRLLDAADADLKLVADWYNNSMDRISGWYKRNIQRITLVAGFIIVVIANADTIDIAKTLWTNPTLRTNITEAAKVRAAMPRPNTTEYTEPEDPAPTPPISNSPGAENASNPADLTEQERVLLGELLGWDRELRKLSELVTIANHGGQLKNASCIESLHLLESASPWNAQQSSEPDYTAALKETTTPNTVCASLVSDIRKARTQPGLQWSQLCCPSALALWLKWLLAEHFLGWLLTAIAVSLGAPFWFDLLNKVINIRSSGKIPGQTKESVTPNTIKLEVSGAAPGGTK